MEKRKILSLLVISLLIVSLIIGCTNKKPIGGDNEAPSSGQDVASKDDDKGKDKEVEIKWDPNVNPAGVYPIVKEPVTLSIYTHILPSSNVTDYVDNEFTKMLEEKTNIKLDFVVVPAEDIGTQLALMITTEEQPDILLANTFNELTQDIYGKHGTILALNDYIEEYGIETKKMFNKYPEVEEALIRSDGKIYCMPQISDPKSGDSPNKMWIYEPFLEALGKKMPTTTDELYDFLKAVKDGDPNGNGKSDEIPIAGCTAYHTWNPIAYLMNAFVYDDGGESLVVNNGILEPVYTKTDYKDGLKFIAQLYREELIMHETFTQSIEQLQELANNPAPIVGIIPTHAPFIATEDRSPDYSVMPPIKAPGSSGGYASTRYTTKTTGPVITNNCKHPEAAFRFLDMFYEEEISISVLNGIRGIEWDYNDNPGLLTDNGEVAKYKALTHETRMNSRWPMLTNFYRPPSLGEYWVDDSPEGRKTREDAKAGQDDPLTIGYKKFLEAQPKVYANYAPPSDIRLPQVLLYDEEAGSEAAELRSAVHGYVYDMRMKFVRGEVDIDAEWDDYIRQLDQLGLERLLELNQAAYDIIHK